jgi:hypothetical protein
MGRGAGDGGAMGANCGVTLGGATGAVRPTAEPWDEERVMAEPWGQCVPRRSHGTRAGDGVGRGDR